MSQLVEWIPTLFFSIQIIVAGIYYIGLAQ
jgi:hypothetical protein